MIYNDKFNRLRIKAIEDFIKINKKKLKYKNYYLGDILVRFLWISLLNTDNFNNIFDKKNKKYQIITCDDEIEYSFFKYFNEKYNLKKNIIKKRKILLSIISHLKKYDVIIFILNLFKFNKVTKNYKDIDILVHTNSDRKFNLFYKIAKKCPKLNFGVIIDFENNQVNNEKNIFFINKKNFFNFEKNMNLKSVAYKFSNLFNVYENIIKFYKPKIILVIEGDSVVHSVLAEIAKTNAIKIYCLEWGLGPPFLYFNNNDKLDFKNYFKKYIFLSWGKKVVKYLKSRNQVDKYKIIGNPNFSFNQKKNSSNNILFALGPVYEFQWNSKDDIKKLLQFANWIGKRFPKKTIYIRPHHNHMSNAPTADWQKYLGLIKNNTDNLNNIIINYKDDDLERIVDNVSIVCTISSTLAHECISFGKIPFYINTYPNVKKNYKEIIEKNLGIFCNDYETAQKRITDLFNNRPFFNNLKKNINRKKKDYIFCTGDKSISILDKEFKKNL